MFLAPDEIISLRPLPYRNAERLVIQTRANRARLIDFLNGDDQRFLTLRFAGGVCLVNRTQIVQVRRR